MQTTPLKVETAAYGWYPSGILAVHMRYVLAKHQRLCFCCSLLLTENKSSTVIAEIYTKENLCYFVSINSDFTIARRCPKRA